VIILSQPKGQTDASQAKKRKQVNLPGDTRPVIGPYFRIVEARQQHLYYFIHPFANK
jgi:hypothetical protein